MGCSQDTNANIFVQTKERKAEMSIEANSNGSVYGMDQGFVAAAFASPISLPTSREVGSVKPFLDLLNELGPADVGVSLVAFRFSHVMHRSECDRVTRRRKREGH